MDRAQQIREQRAAKVATFAIGDNIKFHVADETGITEYTGDAIEIELTGKILSIDGDFAQVEHQYGICRTWLAIADKV